jgi:ATP-dependent Clp protease ATP-binding subunit ClpA
VIIMTSNVGSHIIHDANPIGFSVNQKVKNNSQEEVRKRLLDALRQTFRPEFLNRIDDIIVFNTLSKEHLSVIIDLQLQRLEKMLAERGLKLEVTPAAKELLMTDGYDESYGARPMRRSIQRLVQDPLALRLLAGDFLAGETILVDTDGDGGKLRFEKVATPEPVAA